MGEGPAEQGEQQQETPERTASLREAVERLSQALDVLTRERRPYDWGSVQFQLAQTLDLLGQREGSRETRLAAVDAYFSALDEIDQEKRQREPHETD